jgi:hypothetical protein
MQRIFWTPIGVGMINLTRANVETISAYVRAVVHHNESHATDTPKIPLEVTAEEILELCHDWFEFDDRRNAGEAP